MVENQKQKNEEEPVKCLRQKCIKCLRGANLIKTVVFLVCTPVVIQQISACISKLIHVPITTYTHFDFNKTIEYPSLTFCREPPYKFAKLRDYGLYAHPRYTSRWRGFNFSAVTLDQLWEDITYNHSEFFVQYGLNGLMDSFPEGRCSDHDLQRDVEIRSTNFFVHGRCHTLVPKVSIDRASKSTGYSITLQHSAEDIATTTSIHPPGYHIYVHYTREPFTEVEVYNGGLVDYLYVYTGETVDVKLTVDQYSMISSEEDPCISDENFSANNCTTQRVWDIVGETAGCSGPWMHSIHPHCDNFTSMRNLISSYLNTYDDHDTEVCPRFCRAFLYNAFVTERQRQLTWDTTAMRWAIRQGEAALQAQLYIHFNSMMVPVYEERYNYDWNLFIADLGGSVGFLLGLSVIGFISFMSKMWDTIVSPFIKTQKIKNNAPSVTSSTVTAQIEDLYVKHKNDINFKNDDPFMKCNDWQMKNLNNF